VIGDRVSTDIAGADRLGWDAALVLTGISTVHDLEASGLEASVLPDLSALLRD
jgi:ribonucleotide monophosphatase NagD (HAD superfamily)